MKSILSISVGAIISFGSSVYADEPSTTTIKPPPKPSVVTTVTPGIVGGLQEIEHNAPSKDGDSKNKPKEVKKPDTPSSK